MMSCCTSRKKEEHSNPSSEMQAATSLSKAMMIEKYIFQHFRSPADDESMDDSISVPFKPTNMFKGISKSDWLRIIHTKAVNEVPSSTIMESLQKGIPNELRPAIWIWMSGAESIRLQHGNNLFAKLKSAPSSLDSVIFKEVQLALKGANPLVREDLFDVLRAYVNYDSEVKITQDFITLVMFLFEQFDTAKYRDVSLSFARNQYEIPPDMREVTTFWVLVYMMNGLQLREVFERRFSKKSYLALIEQTPNIMNHLKGLGLTLYQAFRSPILILLHHQCKKDLFLTIFDQYLWQGEISAITVWINLIKQSEDVLLLLQSKADTITYLNESLIPYGLERLLTDGHQALFKRIR